MRRNFSLVLVVAMIQLVCVSTSFAAPIHDAARDGKLAEVQRLIDEDRANLNARIPFSGQTPLHFAAANGHTAIVQALLASGANLDVRVATNGKTPLHFAAESGHTATAQSLIAAGANCDAFDERRRTPLQLAQQNGYADTVAALQPQAIVQIHTQTAEAHTIAGNHSLAARSHTWAAQALPETEEARLSYTRAAESHTAAGDHGAAATSYKLAGNLARAAESHTQHAHAQAAAGDFASAVEAHHLAHATHTALGNHGLAGLSHHLATLLAPAVPVRLKAHLASASGLVQRMETHFETAVTKASEIQFHRARGDEPAAALAEYQASESLESGNRSEAQAIVAYETAFSALDGALQGAMTAHEKAKVANAPAELLAQHAAIVDSLQAHMRSVSTKIDETRASATAENERVSAARGI